MIPSDAPGPWSAFVRTGWSVQACFERASARCSLVGLDVLLLAAAIVTGLVLGWQGWRNTVVTPDYLPYIDAAEQLLTHGRIPAAGHLSSLASYFPPGGAYWFVPGMILFDDVRLFETPAMVLCYVGSVIVLFLLAREAFGRSTARLAVALFAVSALGIKHWDGFVLGHFYNPFLYLCHCWCSMQWVVRRRGGYLAAMLAITSAAIYLQHPMLVLMLAPVPLLWAAYRPPIASGAIGAVTVASLLLWAPYLAFQWQRGFADVRSQLFGVSLLPASYAESWCEPGLQMIPLPREHQPLQADGSVAMATHRLVPPESSLSRKSRSMLGLLAGNTDQASIVPGMSSVVLLAIVGYACRSEWRARRHRVHHVPARVATLALALPWAVTIVLAEGGRTDRTMWLWPMQLAIAAAALIEATARIPSQALRLLPVVAVVAAIAANPFVISRLEHWREAGWGGSSPDTLKAVSYIAAELQSKGRARASIGYQTWTMGFLARYNIVDRRYKWGSEFDAWLKYSYGIENDNRCAEGLAPEDEWRIIQMAPRGDPLDDLPFESIQGDMTVGFEPTARFGSYVVFKHVADPVP